MPTIELEDLTVDVILRRWPAAVRLFIDRGLLCVGCPIAPFHTLANVSFEHGVDHDDLVEAVLGIATVDDATTGPASARR